jgi:ADP-ribosylation factor GTPase-activating protein 1
MENYAHPQLSKIMKIADNNNCFDCNAIRPQWASVNNGIFLCLKCAGVHRGFGVNISFVRSLTMDNW